MAGTSSTYNLWHAAACLYAYGTEALIGLDDEGGVRCNHLLNVPELDLQEITREYLEGRLALQSAKHFVDAFHHIRNSQGAMRKRGESTWRADLWIRGEVG